MKLATLKRGTSAEHLHAALSERYAVEPAAWERIRGAARVLAVGTTTTRVLESLARGAPLAGRTDLFITPGFEFQQVWTDEQHWFGVFYFTVNL